MLSSERAMSILLGSGGGAILPLPTPAIARKRKIQEFEEKGWQHPGDTAATREADLPWWSYDLKPSAGWALRLC